jgi:uncharacterized protein YecT (DUF1311 family)
LLKYLALVLFVTSSAFPLPCTKHASLANLQRKSQDSNGNERLCGQRALKPRWRTFYNSLSSKTESQPEALAKIKAVQKAWLVYRDAYIAAMYPAKNKQAEYGSMQESKLARRQAHTKTSCRPQELLRESTD